MKRLTKFFPILLILLMGCSHNTEVVAKSKKMYSNTNRMPASTVESVAIAYYNLAVELSKVRASAPYACETDVYQNNILDALTNAVRYGNRDTDFMMKELKKDNDANTAIKSQVGATLTYKILSSTKNGWIDPTTRLSTMRSLFKNTTFESQGVGAYGHHLEYHFKSNGTVVKRRMTDIDTYPVTWSETKGKYKINKFDQRKHGFVISMTTKLLTGPNKGKDKTEAFVLRQTCDYGTCMYGLVPINKVNGKSFNVPFYDFTVYDMKTDECDA